MSRIRPAPVLSRVKRRTPTRRALWALLLALPLLGAQAAAAADPKTQAALAAFRSGDYAKALRLTRPLAAKEDPQAMYLLGVMYEQGKGVARDDPSAVKWYAAAARKGNYASAQYNLARMYLDGRGLRKNEVRAREWLRAAAAQGHPESKKLLAELDGTGAPVAAGAGAGTAAGGAAGAAPLAPAGSAVPGDVSAAAPARAAPAAPAAPRTANAGDGAKAAAPPAAAAGGAGAAPPAGAPAARATAFAAASPSEPAGSAAVAAVKPVAPAATTTETTPQAAAPAAGANPPGTLAAAPPATKPLPNPAVLAAYAKGDYARALKLARPLAENEDGAAMYVLGKLFEQGKVVKRDDYTAVKWLAAAARKANYAPAQYSLARMYLDGRGVAKNAARAKEWLSIAAAQGHNESQRLLAELGGGKLPLAVPAPGVGGAAPIVASVVPPAPLAAAQKPATPAPQPAASTAFAPAAVPAATGGPVPAPAEVPVRPQAAGAPTAAGAPATPAPATASAPAAAAAPAKGVDLAAAGRWAGAAAANTGDGAPKTALLGSGKAAPDAAARAAIDAGVPTTVTRGRPAFGPYSPRGAQIAVTALQAAYRRAVGQDPAAARPLLDAPLAQAAMRYWEAEAAGERRAMDELRAAIQADAVAAAGVARGLLASSSGADRATAALLTAFTRAGGSVGEEVCDSYVTAAGAPGPDHPPAQYHAALCIAQRDAKQSLSWLHAAADAGHGGALETLGRACIESAEKNWGCASHYFELAAQRGRASSMALYGWVLSNQPAAGPKDYAEAYTWYRRGAAAGDLFATNNLGEMFERGRGTPKDEKQARQWYGQAAEAGFGPGQFNYGRLLLAGAGGPVDREGAVAWLQKAERNGVVQAKAALRQIEAKR